MTLSIENIPELYIAERFSMSEAEVVLKNMTKMNYSHDEVFGTYCNVNEYIKCPTETAYRYAANPLSLQEWTFSVRELKSVKKDLYCGLDVLAPNTNIYVRTECCDDAKTVDYLCAWDNSEQLWMRYYMRFVDAKPAVGKPGTIVSWLNCRHPFYNRDPNNPKHVQESQARKDRPWVGDLWPFFYAGHKIEARNMKAILEARQS